MEIEHLQACYHAFLQRQAKRGTRSIRTKQGFDRLRKKYQPRLQYLENNTGDDQQMLHDKVLKSSTPREENPVLISDEVNASTAEAVELKSLIGVFFDTTIKRLILEQCWPIAHYGGYISTDATTLPKYPLVPEWQELDKNKYNLFMFTILQWLFPGLPTFEAQEQADHDWHSDCSFDGYGTTGLSFEGFTTSLLDLALACAGGEITQCMEFLEFMTKRLETFLPTSQAQTMTTNTNESKEDKSNSISSIGPSIVWRTIPLEQLSTCPVRIHPEYYQLNAKLARAPMFLLIHLSASCSLQFDVSTSAKRLVRAQHHRPSRSLTDHTSYVVEQETQWLGSFPEVAERPTILVIPNHIVSRRTSSLYASCRLQDTTQNHVLISLCTSITTPFPLLNKSLCGRMERQKTRIFLFTMSQPFKIIIKTSLLHHVTTSQLSPLHGIETAICHSEGEGEKGRDHTFIFVIQKEEQIETIPRQWLTTLTRSNETKTIYMSTTETQGYYLYLYTLHGIYYEISLDQLDEREIEMTKTTNSVQTQGVDSTKPLVDLDPSPPTNNTISTTPTLMNVTTSTKLLQHLLRLRQQRRIVTPLPSHIGGTRITTFKQLSTAATLRAKFLQARVMDRTNRYNEQEEATRNNVMTKSTRHVDIKKPPDDKNENESKTCIIEKEETKADKVVLYFKEKAMQVDKQVEVKVDDEEKDQEDSEAYKRTAMWIETLMNQVNNPPSLVNTKPVQDEIISIEKEIETPHESSAKTEEWIESQYVQNMAHYEEPQQRLAMMHRVPFVLNKPLFDEQEDGLPWSPVWQVEVGIPRVTQHHVPLSPARPRPQTARAMTPRRPEASQSAVLAYQRTRRIRSARIGTRKTPSTMVNRPQEMEMIPNAFKSVIPPELVVDEKVVDEQVVESKLDELKEVEPPSISQETDLSRQTIKKKTKKKMKKKRLTLEQERFAQRVQDLIEISSLVQIQPG